MLSARITLSACIPPGEDGYFLRSPPLTLTVAGANNRIRASRILTADDAAAELSGQAIRLKRKWNVNAEAGRFAVEGADIL